MSQQLAELESRLRVRTDKLVSLQVSDNGNRCDRFSALVPRLSDTELRQLDIQVQRILGI